MVSIKVSDLTVATLAYRSIQVTIRVESLSSLEHISEMHSECTMHTDDAIVIMLHRRCCALLFSISFSTNILSKCRVIVILSHKHDECRARTFRRLFSTNS